MSVSGVGTVWNLPNYSGELFTADAESTPLLSMIGGLTGGGLTTDNFEFPTASLYSYDSATQPDISEDASVSGVTSKEIAITQETNVTQIFQRAITLSYAKLANLGRMSGINTAGQKNNKEDERAFQIQLALQGTARDVEYTFLNGVYQKSTASNVSNKTRGLFSLLSGTSNETDAGSAELTKAMFNSTLKAMFDNGAKFTNVVLFTNSTQKQKITDLFGYAPTDRNIGGLNIKQIETDFGNIGVVLNRFVPQNKILLADVSVIAPVFQPVPKKGVLFVEPMAKTGAADSEQLFGMIGLDHGPAFMHGSIINLA